MCVTSMSNLCHIWVMSMTHICCFCMSWFFLCFFNWRYGKAAISKERKKSARYNEDVEDFPESCAADKVDAAVDYLINQVRLQDGDINAQDKYGMLLNSWINYLLNSCFFSNWDNAYPEQNTNHSCFGSRRLTYALHCLDLNDQKARCYFWQWLHIYKNKWNF